MREWNRFQTAIFEEVESGEGNMVINALAGTGKTTTIIEAANRAPDEPRTLMSAFNRTIADTLQQRLPHNATAKTLHGLGAMVLNQAGKKFDIQKEKGFEIAKSITEGFPRTVAAAVRKGAAMCKTQLATNAEQIADVLDSYDIEAFPHVTPERMVQMVGTAMAKAKQTENVIDFDDMVWLPVVLGLEPRYKYDRIMIDEGQDMDPCQMRLVLSFAGPSTRVAVVGDPNQGIYAWRGADSESLNRAQQKLGAKVLPLSVTYRCAKAIVREANKIVPQLECPSDAPEGKVVDITDTKLLDLAQPGDFVIGRSNAAVIATCLRFLRNKKRATIQGQDLGERLRGLINRMDSGDVEDLLERVDTWRAAEVKRRQDRDKPYTHINDSAACLKVFAEGCKTISEVLQRVRDCFDDGTGGRVIISTAHRVKGLERDRVFMLADSFRRKRPVKDAAGNVVRWEIPKEEDNLYYVACTRAKSELYMVAKTGTDAS